MKAYRLDAKDAVDAIPIAEGDGASLPPVEEEA